MNKNKRFGFDLELIPDYLNSKETAEKAKGFECVILRGKFVLQQKKY